MTSPAGTISLAQENLRTTLADSTTFRALASAADRAGALVRIHHEGLPEPQDGREYTLAELAAYRPFGVVYTNEISGLRRERHSTGQFGSSGRLKLLLYRNCPAGVGDEPSSDANLEWKNTVGKIIDELCDLAAAGASGHLVFDAIAVDAGPFWSKRDVVPTQGCWQGVEIGIDWRG